MLVRSLQGLIVALAVAAGVEIGFLQWGTEETQDAGYGRQGTGDREWVPASPVSAPCPVPGVLSAAPPQPVIAAKPAKKRKKPAAPVTGSADALAECAREGGPLCGMPSR